MSTKEGMKSSLSQNNKEAKGLNKITPPQLINPIYTCPSSDDNMSSLSTKEFEKTKDKMQQKSYAPTNMTNADTTSSASSGGNKSEHSKRKYNDLNATQSKISSNPSSWHNRNHGNSTNTIITGGNCTINNYHPQSEKNQYASSNKSRESNCGMNVHGRLKRATSPTRQFPYNKNSVTSHRMGENPNSYGRNCNFNDIGREDERHCGMGHRPSFPQSRHEDRIRNTHGSDNQRRSSNSNSSVSPIPIRVDEDGWKRQPNSDSDLLKCDMALDRYTTHAVAN